MEKKYILTDNKRTAIGPNNEEITVYRIMALRDVGDDVNKGDLGGFIEKEENLSHEDECWVFDNAYVYENAKVTQYAHIKNNAEVFGNAIISGCADICGESNIYENAKVSGHACIDDYAEVYGNAIISGYTNLKGETIVNENANICGYIEIKDANIFGSTQIRDDVSIIGRYNIAGDSYIGGCTKIISDNGHRHSIYCTKIESGDIYNSSINGKSDIREAKISKSTILGNCSIIGTATDIYDSLIDENVFIENSEIHHCELKYCKVSNSNIMCSTIHDNISFVSAKFEDRNYISINNLFGFELLIYPNKENDSEIIIRNNRSKNYRFNSFLSYLNRNNIPYFKRIFIIKFIKSARRQLLKK